MTVVPVVHSQQLLNRARRGLDPAGRACGAPLGGEAARKRYQKELHAIGSIRSYLGCYGKDRHCKLTVRVTTERDGHSKVLAR